VVIPFLDLKAQYRSIKAEIDAAVLSVLESGHFILGTEVTAFEEEFASHTGARYGVGLNSGTSALHLALLAAGVGPGDEVVTVPFTFVATVAAICYTGARPVFVDIDPRSYTMDPNCLEAAITHRTKVILPVHLYGQPADMDPILEMARHRQITVIEDAAQAHGARYKGRSVGSIGDIGCFSFYPGKNLGACGEAGIAVTNNPEYARSVRMLRDWGQERKYHHVMRAYNYRMEALQGAVLRVKLRHLEAWTEARRAHAALYRRLLSGVGVELPCEMPYARHVYHVFVVRSRERDSLMQALQAGDIQTGVHYPLPVHQLKPYANAGSAAGDLQNSERAAAEVLSLPMFAELSDAQIETVCNTVHQHTSAGVR
jgi:dTDP-4-amino-4,6-dideoxygalactose transaminase